MNVPLSTEDYELLFSAREVALKAYAKYSHFRVGAALRGRTGTFRGTNIENASYGLSFCAERAALVAAIAAGERDISVIAVACIDADPEGALQERMPCGACRQWIKELAPQARILVDGKIIHCFSADDLLPNAFDLRKK